MSTMTTIKVSSELRDRINTQAAAEGRTAGSFIEKLLAEHLRRRDIDLAIQQMNAMSPQERDEYMAEFREWEDATINDGLDG